MLTNAIFVTTLITLALGLWLLQECSFLIPYRHVLFVQYGATLAIFAAVFFVNGVAAVYLIGRLFFLKDTGRKLAHLEKQLRSGSALSEERSKRLDDPL